MKVSQDEEGFFGFPSFFVIYLLPLLSM